MVDDILKSISSVEHCIDEMFKLRDSIEHFQMQFECVEKAPNHCEMAKCSPKWRAKLLAKLHAECTQLCEEYTQSCKQIDNEVNEQLSDYLIRLRKDPSKSPSYTHFDDFVTMLEYLRQQVARYYQCKNEYPLNFSSRELPSEPPNYDIRMTIKRIKADLTNVTSSPSSLTVIN